MFHSSGALKSETDSKSLAVWEAQVSDTSPSGLLGRHFAESIKDRKEAFNTVSKEIDVAELETEERRTLDKLVSGDEEISTSGNAAGLRFSRSFQSTNFQLDKVSPELIFPSRLLFYGLPDETLYDGASSTRSTSTSDNIPGDEGCSRSSSSAGRRDDSTDDEMSSDKNLLNRTRTPVIIEQVGGAAQRRPW